MPHLRKTGTARFRSLPLSLGGAGQSGEEGQLLSHRDIGARALAGILLVSALAALALRIGCSEDSAPRSRRYSRTFPVMGTMASMIIYCPPDSADAVLAGVEQTIHRLDHQLSVYEDGATGRLNADSRAALVNPHLHNLVTASDSLHRLTGGRFDPTTGGLVRLWGFPGSPAVPESAAIKTALLLTGWDSLVTVTADSVRLASGVMLDFGAAAKGYAADVGWQRAMDLGADAALVEIGGEVRCGSAAGFEKTWTVGIRHPRSEGLLETIELNEGAVATSGDYESYFMDDTGRRYSHILDPDTGWPANGAASATVLARSCLVADAVATALVIGGVHLADSLPEAMVRAILIIEDSGGSLVERRRGEWQQGPNG